MISSTARCTAFACAADRCETMWLDELIAELERMTTNAEEAYSELDDLFEEETPVEVTDAYYAQFEDWR